MDARATVDAAGEATAREGEAAVNAKVGKHDPVRIAVVAIMFALSVAGIGMVFVIVRTAFGVVTGR